MSENMIQLHPEILKKDGKEQFVVLPWEEYVQLQELLDDVRDLVELRKAKSEDDDAASVPLAEVMQRLGME